MAETTCDDYYKNCSSCYEKQFATPCEEEMRDREGCLIETETVRRYELI